MARDRGDGSYRRRGADSWELRVYAGKGRRVTRTVRGTEPQAKRALRQLLDEIDQGHHHGPDAPLAAVLEEWYRTRSADWTPKNREETRRFVDRVTSDDIAAVTIRALGAEHLDGLYARLRGAGLAASSVHRYHDVIHAALNQAVRWRWLNRNPADDANPGRAERPQIKAPRDDELDRLLDHIADGDPEYLTYITLAADLGWRRGELCALRWTDLDLDTGTARAVRRVSAGVVIAGTKGNGRRPPTRIGPGTLALLRQHRARAAAWALECGTSLPTNGYLFSRDPDGATPWRADSVTQRFIRTRDRLDLGHVRLHDLRHYVATTLLAAGVDVGTVADRLGHTLASTTLNIYRSHVPAADEKAAQILDQRRRPSTSTGS